MDRLQESVVVKDRPPLCQLTIGDPPQSDSSHLDRPAGWFYTEEGAVVSPTPAGKYPNHVSVGNDLLLVHSDVWKGGSNHCDPTLDALGARRGSRRSRVVDEVGAEVTISSTEVAAI